MLRDADSVTTIAEASTSPDVRCSMAALLRLFSALIVSTRCRMNHPVRGKAYADGRQPSEEALGKLEIAARLMRLSQGIVGAEAATTPRPCGARSSGWPVRWKPSAWRVDRAGARGRSGDQGACLGRVLEQARDDLHYMPRCAQRRVLGGLADRPSSDYGGPGLRALIEHGLTTDDTPPWTASRRPRSRSSWGSSSPSAKPSRRSSFASRRSRARVEVRSSPSPWKERRAPLPNWLLPRRTIGSFYVVRPLGTGGVSSVFVARRYDERNDAKAESFALKVPEYDLDGPLHVGAGILRDVREEGGALLSLPAHPNLARFVTFDLGATQAHFGDGAHPGHGARPAPPFTITTMQRVTDYLDGILAGLEAMHEVGVGHLDIKPTNVILRDGETPVLVDLGSAAVTCGRVAGTVEYTAPEVLGAFPEDHQPMPPPADMYWWAASPTSFSPARSLRGCRRDDAGHASRLPRRLAARAGCHERAERPRPPRAHHCRLPAPRSAIDFRLVKRASASRLHFLASNSTLAHPNPRSRSARKSDKGSLHFVAGIARVRLTRL